MNTVPRPSILLVEDDLRLAALVSRYLENQGLDMTIVSRGDQVVEKSSSVMERGRTREID